MISKLLSGWSLVRWIRLILAVVIAIQAVLSSDILLGILALILVYQVYFNLGCGCNASCEIPANTKSSHDGSPN